MTNTAQQDAELAVRTLSDRLGDAWASADADAYGALFTEDADYVNAIGTHYTGRAAIVESHRALWRKIFRGTRLEGRITQVRLLAEDVAIAHGVGTVLRGRQRMTRRNAKVQSMIAVRRDGQWRFAVFHNTEYHWLKEAIGFTVAPGSAPADAPTLSVRLSTWAAEPTGSSRGITS
ncbi:SgcJ/EcaC family oxidoreductase [Solihabitans fulvus]|uniref:SgcJ/EcaC family oxidoreductase n=1 Tax=Solihabitans fulvus TaxID=1892852 RepID=A0A5B2WSY4_9PSEU|nr:SgcJ/EcaC family oxidoreductase [Solihabitans fulvus]KAA2254068.1 SgcJ/EcaC family oxidoreductase [Solihabitans fulvus]